MRQEMRAKCQQVKFTVVKLCYEENVRNHFPNHFHIHFPIRSTQMLSSTLKVRDSLKDINLE